MASNTAPSSSPWVSTTSNKPNEQSPGSWLYGFSWIGFAYDVVVIWLSNSYAWKCPTATVQLPLWEASLGERHLDIGVGSGYYPATALPKSKKCREITLMDLNDAAMDHVEKRIRRAMASSPQGSSRGSLNISKVIADAAKTLPLPETTKFDSVSLFYLFHCMPGPPEAKVRVFDAVRPHVEPRNGVVAGTTILGREVPRNWFAALLMKIYNNKGLFDNWDDSEKVFRGALERNFGDVRAWRVGRVLCFEARKPRESKL